MPSVVIAAHNEEAVLGACLRALQAQQPATPQIVVSANGCTDQTAQIAAGFGVAVVDLPVAGKARALNAGDDVAEGFPRIYLDADIRVPEDAVARILSAFRPGILAVVPRRRIETTGRSWLVRSYFAINERLPAFRKGLFGRGMIALSADGRARFTRFPDLVADDLFLDSQFTDDEKCVAEDVEVTVEAPRTSRDLIRRLVRVRRGNAQLRAAVARGDLEMPVRPTDRWAWLRDVVVRRPWLVFAAAPYVAITVIAALRARRAPSSAAEWGRDDSTRIAAEEG